MDDREIFEALVQIVRENDLDSLKLRIGETRFELIRREPQSTPAYPSLAPVAHDYPFDPSPSPGAAPGPSGPTASERTQRVTAPVIGVFYRAPSPGADPFVSVGDRVEVGQTLCILEAMKLMNEITSDYAGIVTRVVPENGELVSLGEDMFWIE